MHFTTRASVATIGLCKTMVWAGVLGLLAAGPAMAQSGSVVPLQGQAPEQAAADQQQCAAQASSQTGYNPATSAPQAAAPTPQVGQRAAGAVRGAAAGKVVSNVTKNSSTDDAMEGSAKLGAMAGGSRQRRANRDQRQQTQQQQATEQQNASAYDSSLSACLQGRGYTLQ